MIVLLVTKLGHYMPFNSFFQISALFLTILSLSSSLMARDEDLSSEHDSAPIRISLPLPNEVVDQILSLLDLEEVVTCSAISYEFSKLMDEQFRQYVFKFFPRYKVDGEVMNTQGKSWKHLACLLRWVSEPIDYSTLLLFYPREALLNIIDAAFSTPKASYLKGLLFEMGGQEKEAWHNYSRADKEGYLLASEKINKSIYYGYLGQGKRPGQERLEDLKARGAKDEDKNAQKWLIDALLEGRLGQKPSIMSRSIIEDYFKFFNMLLLYV